MKDATNKTKPTHTAYVVRDGKDEKSFWREIGVAWSHRDGKGLYLLLDGVPANGRIVLRLIKPKTQFYPATAARPRNPAAGSSPLNSTPSHDIAR